MRALPWILLAILMTPMARAAAGEPARRVVIVQGSGGEEVYEREFTDWTRRLRDWLVRAEFAAEDRLAWLGAVDAGEAGGPTSPAKLETIGKVLAEVIEGLPEDGELLLVLIGHGAWIAEETRFMLPGPDLTGEALGEMLAEAGDRRIVLINATASSAGFINVLSAPGRIIVTATKSVNERNATRFMESLLQGLEDGSADENRDGRISLLEAARQADRITVGWYKGQGYLVTEHPLLDDNGDGLGTRLVPAEPGDPAASESAHGEGAMLDGAAAARYFLKDFSFPPEAPRALVDRYTGLLDEIETVKLEKSKLDEAAYRGRLRPLLIEAARAHREIRRIIDEAATESAAGATGE